MTLRRIFVPAVSFGTGAWSVGVLGGLGPVTPSDESFAAIGVSFLTDGCTVGALSPLLLDGVSGFETSLADGCVAANGS